MRAQLEIRLFGGLSVADSEQPVRLRSRKAEALLAYLAVTGRPSARETLATLLWEDSDADQALANLRKILTDLRGQLGDHLVIGRQSIALATADTIWLDTANVAGQLSNLPASSAATPATAAGVSEALVDYSGPFLHGFEQPDQDGAEFIAWLSLERERLARLVSDGYAFLTSFTMANRDFTPAETYARGWLEVAPISEAAHRALMLILARRGEVAAALAQYEKCRARLATELNVAPTLATIQLHDQIQSAKGLTTTLPKQIPNLIGRADELAIIETALLTGGARLFSLVGPGGIGKTHLALYAARNLAPAFLHGAIYLPLANVAPGAGRHGAPDPLRLALAGVLGLPAGETDALASALTNHLRQKEVLLVLDNFEHLLTSADFLSDLVADAPGLRCLVTSRERLNLARETVLELGGLEVSDEPEHILASSAGRFFLHEARQARHDFAPNAQNEADIWRICQLLDGVPLGIELAAANIRADSPRQIAEHLAATHNLIAAETMTVPARHASLRATFDYSWQRLTESEQALLSRLSVFRGAFLAEAAVAVADADHLGLLNLVDKSMLRLTAMGRYRLPKTLRHFAGEKLTSKGESGAVMARFSSYFAQRCAVYAAPLAGRQQAAALKEMALDAENIRAGWDWACHAGAAPALAGYLDALWRFLEINGWLHEGVSRMQRAAAGLNATGAGAERLTGRLWYAQGYFQERISDFDSAKSTLETSLAIFQALAEPLWEAKVRNHLAMVAFGQGQSTEAEVAARAALTLAESVADNQTIADSLSHLAYIANGIGQYDDSLALAQQSLARRRVLGNPRSLAITLNVLGRAQANLGDTAAAERSYDEVLGLCKKIEDNMGIAYARRSLGDLAYQRQDVAAARNHYEAALAKVTRLGEPWAMANLTGRLGNVALADADYVTAQALYQQSQALCAAIGEARGQAIIALHLARVSFFRGDPAAAQRDLRATIPGLLKMELIPFALVACLLWARLQAARGHTAAALAVALFVAAHEAADPDVLVEAHAVIADWRATLSDDEMTAASVTASALELVTVLAPLL